jgi:hypothetical protein
VSEAEGGRGPRADPPRGNPSGLPSSRRTCTKERDTRRPGCRGACSSYGGEKLSFRYDDEPNPRPSMSPKRIAPTRRAKQPNPVADAPRKNSLENRAPLVRHMTYKQPVAAQAVVIIHRLVLSRHAWGSQGTSIRLRDTADLVR